MCWIQFLLFQLPASAQHTYEIGFIPARLFGSLVLSGEFDPVSPLISIFTSMISHGGFVHILGNSLIIYILADNVECSMGSKSKFILFSLLTGVAGTLGHGLANPHSEIPLIGISGVASAYMGAYVLLWPKANIKTLIGFLIFFKSFNIPAIFIFLFWLLGQISGFLSSNSNVAFDTHLYSMLAGMCLIAYFKRPEVKFFQQPKTKAFSRVVT